MNHIKNINWTEAKKEKVIRMIDKWLREYDAYSGEKIMQDDDCQIYAPGLLSDIADELEDIIETNEDYY